MNNTNNPTTTTPKKGIADYNSATEVKVANFESGSLRKFAEWYRASRQKLPKLYYYISTFPVRTEDGKKVLIEGRYTIGAKTPDGIISLVEIAARGGYKIRTTAKSEAAAKELLADLKDAMNQTGKYAPKPKAIRGLK